MPVIRITDATWDRLKRWAIPLEDSPEDAVKKILDSAEEHLKCGKVKKEENHNLINKNPTRINSEKLHRGEKTPNHEFRRPILEALSELGGKASANDILDTVEKKMKSILKAVDYQMLPSGNDIRWHNTAQWERYTLIQEGLLKSESPRGIWEISDKGQKILKEHDF